MQDLWEGVSMGECGLYKVHGLLGEQQSFKVKYVIQIYIHESQK